MTPKKVNEYIWGGQEYQPQKFMIDKESAAVAAIKLNWVNPNIKLCYFHFGMNINKRVNNNYFKNLFINKIWCERIVYGAKALSLFPPQVIIPIWDELQLKGKDINGQYLNEFINYYDTEWIKNTPINYWNYYNGFENRTNNYSESFNHRINTLFDHKKKRNFMFQSIIINY